MSNLPFRLTSEQYFISYIALYIYDKIYIRSLYYIIIKYQGMKLTTIESFNQDNISSLIDKNQLLYDIFLAGSNCMSVIMSDQFIILENNTDAPMMNGVIETNVKNDSSECEKLIKEQICQLNSLKRPYFWKIWNSSHPRNLSNILENNGLKLAASSSGMAINLSNLKSEITMIKGFEIQEVVSDNDVNMWLSLLFDIFKIDKERQKVYSQIFSETSILHHASNYIGILNGNPIATGTLFYSAGVAGIYWMSTTSEFQGKGIESNMIAHLLKKAIAKGYKVATLQASNSAMSMLKKIGFNQYCESKKYQKDVTD